MKASVVVEKSVNGLTPRSLEEAERIDEAQHELCGGRAFDCIADLLGSQPLAFTFAPTFLRRRGNQTTTTPEIDDDL